MSVIPPLFVLNYIERGALSLHQKRSHEQAQKKLAHLDPFPPVWNVPYRYTAYFTGRDHVLEQLFSGLYLDAQFWHGSCPGTDRSWWTWQNTDGCGVRSCMLLIERWKMSFREADLIRQHLAAEHG